MIAWPRCEHPNTPENTTGGRCRACHRVSEARRRERNRAARPARELEVCTEGSVKPYTLDQDGLTREDRTNRRNLINGSQRLAKALKKALAA